MSNKKLILTSSGLKNIISSQSLGDEFSFVFPNQTVSMKTIFAEFISPKVSKIHQSDPTMNTIYLSEQIKGISLSTNVISKFKLVSLGESIEITEEEGFQMKIISILLENEDLYSQLNNLFEDEIKENNIDQYIDNLTIFSQIPAFNFFKCTDVIDFISSYFYSADKNKIKQLPKTVIYSIISNSKLRIESEDSLFDFIEELFDDNDDYDEQLMVQFYEQIEFSQLSENKFVRFVERFNPTEMTKSLWSKLAECFYTNIKNMKSSKPERYTKEQTVHKFSDEKEEKVEFNGNESQSLNGIIDFLMKKSGGNVCDNGTIKVTSLNHYSDRIDKNAADIHNTQNYYQTGNVKDSWLTYDFIEKKVHPTHYSIRTRHDCDGNHPRNWVIEGSNTGSDNDWTILDNRQNDTSLNGINSIHTFDIKEHEGSYRYLRFRQTGCNSTNPFNFCTAISALEYFGTIIN